MVKNHWGNQLTWRDVYDCSHKISNTWGDCVKLAKETGYRYMAFNGAVFDLTVSTACNYDNKICDIEELQLVNKVAIPREEYEELLNDSILLKCLDGAGVDNWDGYSEARQTMEEILREIEEQEQ